MVGWWSLTCCFVFVVCHSQKTNWLRHRKICDRRTKKKKKEGGKGGEGGKKEGKGEEKEATKATEAK